MSWRLVLLTVYAALFLLAFYPVALSWGYRSALSSAATFGALLVALSWLAVLPARLRRRGRGRSDQRARSSSWRRGVWSGDVVWFVSLLVFLALATSDDADRPQSGDGAAFATLLELMSVDLPGNDDGWLLMLLGAGSLALAAVMAAAATDALTERWQAGRSSRGAPADSGRG